jgi:hypothetical protein
MYIRIPKKPIIPYNKNPNQKGNCNFIKGKFKNNIKEVPNSANDHQE